MKERQVEKEHEAERIHTEQSNTDPELRIDLSEPKRRFKKKKIRRVDKNRIKEGSNKEVPLFNHEENNPPTQAVDMEGQAMPDLKEGGDEKPEEEIVSQEVVVNKQEENTEQQTQPFDYAKPRGSFHYNIPIEGSIGRKKRKKKKKKAFDFQQVEHNKEFDQPQPSAYPPKPEPDQISETNSVTDGPSFTPYPMKPEADRSLSIGDDELGTVTPTNLEPHSPVETSQVPEENISKVNGIEIVKNPKKKSSFKRDTSEDSHKAKETGANEIEFKREGSLAPNKKKDPNRIWGEALSKGLEGDLV